ncbi:MAG: hypothetical protein Q4A23_03340 [bacterium]|nr:hypothetical protein [bacterium]
MKVIFLGKIKFYDKVVDNIEKAINEVVSDKPEIDFSLVFVWSDEEGEIFWDTYNDMIKFGIPIGKRDDYKTIKNKISRAIEQKIN